MGTTHEFWKAVHAGALTAARELGVEIVWKGPLKEDDRNEQVQIVETLAGSGVDALVLSPLDDRALVRPVAEARRSGIPTVVFNSALQGARARRVHRDRQLPRRRHWPRRRSAGAPAAAAGSSWSGSWPGVEGTAKREEGFLAAAARGVPGDRGRLGEPIRRDRRRRWPIRPWRTCSPGSAPSTPSSRPTSPRPSGVSAPCRTTDWPARAVHVGFDASEKLVEALCQGRDLGARSSRIPSRWASGASGPPWPSSAASPMRGPWPRPSCWPAAPTWTDPDVPPAPAARSLHPRGPAVRRCGRDDR
ncbi:MAG: substrate-binding domain-containing protein [Candidatus Moduliflexus flocculans]|nr:substrate-binding domain-containing protein [Candidatus Moduliflexus flocculans]